MPDREWRRAAHTTTWNTDRCDDWDWVVSVRPCPNFGQIRLHGARRWFKCAELAFRPVDIPLARR
jgi:hypothetical protein